MSKFSDFVNDKKIDLRRLRSASAALERLRPEDRALRLARRNKTAAKDDAKPAKPRSGRPVTDRALSAAISGKTVSGPQKTRILRAVNRLLEQKKQEPTSLDLLF